MTSAEPADGDVRRPRRFGGYELLALLARSRGAATYKARQIKLGRLVTLRVLLPEGAAKPACAARFEREMALASQVWHENLAATLDAGDLGGYRYFVTEYPEGRRLSDVLASETPLDLRRAVGVALDVARALTHLGAQGIVHRAVAPQAIVVSDVGPAKLVGLAAAKPQAPGSADTWFDADVTEALYMAPEVVRGDGGADARGDIYSLGCVLYEMVVGRPPFKGRSAALVLDAHVSRRPRDPRPMRRDLPRDLVQILDRCLRKRREDRYANAGDLAADLASVQAGRPIPAAPTAGMLWPPRPTRPAGLR